MPRFTCCCYAIADALMPLLMHAVDDDDDDLLLPACAA